MMNMGENGTVNGSTNDLPEWAGGKGELEPRHEREALILLKRAVTSGWKIPTEWKNELPKLCMKIALDELKGDRERLRAVEILRAMSRDTIDALQVLDKIERLDSGTATERIELAPIEWNPTRR